jgi:hypothetical protein
MTIFFNTNFFLEVNSFPHHHSKFSWVLQATFADLLKEKKTNATTWL